MTSESNIESSLRTASITLIGFLAALIAYFSYQSDRKLSSLGVHQYLISWAHGNNIVEDNGQRFAYMVLLFTIGIFILFAPFVKVAFHKLVLHQWCLLGTKSTLFNILIAFFFSTFFFWSKSPCYLIFGAIVCLAYCCVGLQEKAQIFRWRGFKSLMIVASLAALLPGLIVKLDLSSTSPEAIVEFQNHYAVVLTSGDALEAGLRMFEQVSLAYSLLFPTLTGIYERLVCPITFGGYVLILKAFYIIAVVSVLALFVRHARGWNLASALAFFLVLPWLHTNQLGLLFPNISPWRWFGLLLGIGSLYFVRKLRKAKLGFCLGLLGGVNLLWNLEVGLAASVGYVAYLSMRENILRFNSSLKTHLIVIPYLIGVTIPLIGFFVVGRLFQGEWPDFGQHFRMLSDLSKLVNAGYTGLPFSYNPVALAMVAHISYVAIKIGYKTGEASYLDSLRYAVAAMSLVWFTYYINRPVDSYLYSQFVLYGFFLIDSLRQGYISLQGRKAFPEPAIIMGALFCLVIIPQVMDGFGASSDRYWDVIRQASKQQKPVAAIKLSGVVLPSDYGLRIKEQADYLRTLVVSGPVTYFSNNSILVPELSGVRSTIHFQDIFMELQLIEKTKAFCTDLVRQAPSAILFDDASTPLVGSTARQACFSNIKQLISPTYKLSAKAHGWEIWKRNAANEGNRR